MNSKGANGKGSKQIPEEWRSQIAEFADYLTALGYSPKTIRTYRSQLRVLAQHCKTEPDTITAGQLIQGLARCQSREYKRGAKKAYVAFFKWYTGIKRARLDNPAIMLPSLPKSSPHPKPCPDSAIEKALRSATNSERIILLLAAECGLRRNEIAQVHSRDVVDDSTGGKSLIVHGKGDKQRIVPLPEDLAIAILAADGWALPSPNGGHVEESYIGKHVAHLLPEGYSLHKLRHRFATVAYADSHDLLAVSKALGHASTETTMAYTALPDERLRPLVQSATMTTQPPEELKKPETTKVEHLPRVEPTKTRQVERRNDGKVKYPYEHHKHGMSDYLLETKRVAVVLLVELCQPTYRLGNLSFKLNAEEFAERFNIESEGHKRRSSVLRAAARLCAREGLIDLRTTHDGSISGNITATGERITEVVDSWATEWVENH